jgi:hypothetical protein
MDFRLPRPDLFLAEFHAILLLPKEAAMRTTWVLESNVFAENCFDEMVAHLKEHRYPFHVVRIIPFLHELVGETPRIDGPCVAYGSLGVQKLANSQGWKPGIWTNKDFSSSAYAAHLGELFLNEGLVICRLSEVAAKVSGLGWPQFFIKPNADDKAFAGSIVEPAEIQKWIGNLDSTGLLAENDVEVVLAKPKRVGREWRTVVVGGQVAAFSLYRNYRKLWTERSIDSAALQAVQDAAERFSPADVYVVDVCETDAGMKIIEYNTFNSAGLYDCDVSAVIEAVSSFVERR